MPSLMQVRDSVSKCLKDSTRKSTKLEIVQKSEGSITTSTPTVHNHNTTTGEKMSKVVEKLLTDASMALNQASNPSKLMHTSSIPILRISLKNLEKRKYLLRVFLCKGSILNLNYSNESDIGDVICNTYTTEDVQAI